MKKYVINVTDKDIKLGKKGDYKICPIARAIRRTLRLKKCDTVCVTGATYDTGLETIRLNKNGATYYTFYKTRSVKTVDRFIQNFDTKKATKPFSFTIQERK